MQTITPHLVQQARQVHQMLSAGHSNREIARHLGCSAPWISQIRRRLPEMLDYLGEPDPLVTLASHRTQLEQLRHDALHLALTIRRELAALDDRVEEHRVDRILGLTG